MPLNRYSSKPLKFSRLSSDAIKRSDPNKTAGGLMRIESSNISLASSSIFKKTSIVTENIHQWDQKSDYKLNSITENSTIVSSKSLQIDKFEPQALLKDLTKDTIPTITMLESDDPLERLGLLHKDSTEKSYSIKYEVMKQIIEAMTGEKLKVFDASELQKATDSKFPAENPSETATQGNAAPQMQGWGINYEKIEKISITEGFEFSAEGNIKTSDGLQIDFSASLTMKRETTSEFRLSIKAGDALIDPIVLDLEGTGLTFSNNKIEFDLDNNGILDNIASATGGTVFLAYDKNGNGLIDNGSELFGPSTGNGYTELSALDQDHNNWIDENDPVFKDLKLWQRNADGSDSIKSLKEMNVGALYTKGAETLFTLAANNQSTTMFDSQAIGVVRETGLFVKETGEIGIMQEIDLKI
jgi:hypothetical protein